MKTLIRTFSLLLIASIFSTSFAYAAAEVGKPAPAFSGKDIQGNPITLSDYQGKIIVIEWVNPECPFVKKHYDSGNMPALQKAAKNEGVIWLSINSSATGSAGDYDAKAFAAWTKSHDATPTAYIRDSDGSIGKLYGAKVTPHMFIISGEGVVVYAGAIDSIRSANKEDVAKATNYITAALESLKKGTPLQKSATTPYGCSIKY